MSQQDLVGVGIPAEAARRLGQTWTTVAGVGTAQTGAASLPAQVKAVAATTTGGATAFVLSGSLGLGEPYWFHNTSATTALVYPPSGGAIDGGSTDASVSVAQNKTRIFNRHSSTAWVSVLTA